MGLLNEKDLDQYLALIGAYFAMKLGDNPNDEQTKEIYRRFDAVREHLYTLMGNNGWVSVNDKIPEHAGDRCLVCAEYGDGKKTVFTAFIGYGEAEWYTYDVIHMEKEREADNRVHHNYRITHWMPLPEPPKEVSE